MAEVGVARVRTESSEAKSEASCSLVRTPQVKHSCRLGTRRPKMTQIYGFMTIGSVWRQALALLLKFPTPPKIMGV